MISYKSKIFGITATMIFCLLGTVAHLTAQETDKASAKQKAVDQKMKYNAAEHLLDDTIFEYFYQSGGGIKIAFYDGMLKYEWISGPRKGNKAKDIPYQSRKIGDELYIVNWQQKDKPDFVTLVINLKQNVIYSSAILRYGTNKEMIHFKGGTVERVQRSVK